MSVPTKVQRLSDEADLELARVLGKLDRLRDACNEAGIRYASIEIAASDIRGVRARVRAYMEPKRREETRHG